MSVTLHHTIDMAGWTGPMREAAARARDLTPVHREIGELLLERVTSNFEAEGGTEKWPPLSVATLLQRARGRSGHAQVFTDRVHEIESQGWRMGPLGRNAARVRDAFGAGRGLLKRAQQLLEGAKPLIWSGRLLRSITYDATTTFVDVGSNLVYAARQFFGARNGTTPARSPFGLTDHDETWIAERYREHIVGGLLR